MDITVYLAKKKSVVDRALEKLLPPARTFPRSVHEAMRYSLFAGGKRVRPILAIASAEALGASTTGLLPVAGAIELIHTYSLVHDDLPAMDDDDLRRGRPTCHKMYGEAIAILAGDGLLTRAFEVLSDPRRTASVGPARLLAIIREISTAAGVAGMVGGQVVDIESEGKNIRFPLLRTMHAYKTGALIRASVRTGALFAGAGSRDLRALTTYGEQVGLAFQIADDILDVTGSSEVTGKNTGGDAKKGKRTYPALHGLEKSQRMAQSAADSAVRALAHLDRKADPLREMAQYIVSRTN